MAKYVPDVKTRRWVIISSTRKKRPASPSPSLGGPASPSLGGPAGQPKTFVCPFCPGNEALTPPEVYRIGPGEANQPGWLVRVVPNKYPITDIHEVIIHSQDDTRDIEELPIEQVTRIMTAYRDRYRAHETNGQVLIFCNHGEHAGASLKHPHSQLAVIPQQINLDTLTREPVNNVVEENKYFVTYCPDFSQWPYEVWIAPKETTGKFGDIEDAALTDLAVVFRDILIKLQIISQDPETMNSHKPDVFIYNYYLYHGIDWYLRIIPRLVHRAGFELGTGLNVNIVDPVEAAERLKAIKVS